MSGSPVEPMLDSAQRAASSGDYSRAESLLREVARLQADRLGPDHPDLASTFNNLAVVCERANNLLDAGKFYRQALSIASACLDADDPLVITSRNNFNEFHRVLGLVDTAAFPHVDSQAPAGELEDSIRRTAERAHDANIFATAPASTSIRLATGIAIGVALLSALAIWWTRPPVEPRTVEDRVSELGDPLLSVSPSKQSGPSPHASTRTIRQRPPVEVVTRLSEPSTEHATSRTTVAASTQGPAQAIEVSVCESLSMVSGRWECTPSSDAAAGIELYFYTRIVSPTTSRIHHRWYQNGVLRTMSASLSTQVVPVTGRTVAAASIPAIGA